MFMKKDKIVNHVICYLFGHKENDMTDSGYPFCKRCGCHSYWEREEWFRAGLLLKPIRFIKWSYCNIKSKAIKWMSSGDDLPF